MSPDPWSAPRRVTQMAKLALLGGLVNLFADALLIPGPGPGDALSAPAATASFLAGTPPWRLAAGTVLGSVAIASWGFATPALLRVARARGPWAATLALLHVGFVGCCVAFHVVTGCLGWVGRLGGAASAEELASLLTPMETLLQATLGGTMLALAVTLVALTWRGRPRVPLALPLLSPIVSFSALAAPAQLLPAPLGAPAAILSSTLGGLAWLGALWWWSRGHAKDGAAHPGPP